MGCDLHPFDLRLGLACDHDVAAPGPFIQARKGVGGFAGRYDRPGFINEILARRVFAPEKDVSIVDRRNDLQG